MIIRRIFLNSEEKKSLENNLPAFMSSILTKMLLMIFSLVIAAVSTDGSSVSLNGSSNAEKYKTVDMKHRLLWKHNISRREDKSQCLNTDDGDAYTNKDGVWIFPLTDLDGSRFENRSYIVYAIAGETLIVRTWSLNDATLSIAVKQGDMVRLSASFNADSYEIVEDKKMRLLLKYNITTKEVSFLFDKVDNEDEGQYEMEENCSKCNRDIYAKNNGAWIFHLNVLKPGEIKQGYAGGNILITEVVQESILTPRLYHNDQLIAVLRGSDCDVSTNSPFYGRIRCSKDKDNIRTRIELKNVTGNDTGLYKVETEGSLTQRCFLNITGTYTNMVSVLIIVTTPDRFDGINSDQSKNITLSTTVRSSTVMNLERTLSVPIYVIPVIIGAVAIINLIGFLLWGQRRKIHITKGDQHIAQDECDPGLYLTPIASETPLTVPTCLKRKTDNSNIAQNKNIDPCTGSIHMAQIISMDGYEVVDISNEDPEITPELEEIIHESTENCNTPYSDTSGYLTVLA